MRKSTFSRLLLIASSTFLVLQSCKNDVYLTTPVPVADQSFTEEFDSASAAVARGWKFANTSDPAGPSVWQDGGGIPPFFAGYSNNGTYAGFIGVDYQSTTGGPGLISNWLISPRITIKNGDKIVFYTRALTYNPGYDAADVTDFGNRLRLRFNKNGSTDPASFTEGLLDINPGYKEWHKAPGTYNGVVYGVSDIAQAYPTQWTRFEAVVSGLNQAVEGRFAFNYYVEHAGLCADCRGSGIGIDHVSFISAQ
jgi:hypothetical protein